MNKPQTIQIFLPDGSPRSVKIAEITNRVVKAILIDLTHESADDKYISHGLDVSAQRKTNEKATELNSSRISSIKQVKQLDGSNSLKLSEEVSFLILKREWQKVWFRSQYSQK